MMESQWSNKKHAEWDSVFHFSVHTSVVFLGRSGLPAAVWVTFQTDETSIWMNRETGISSLIWTSGQDVQWQVNIWTCWTQHLAFIVSVNVHKQHLLPHQLTRGRSLIITGGFISSDFDGLWWKLITQVSSGGAEFERLLKQVLTSSGCSQIQTKSFIRVHTCSVE